MNEKSGAGARRARAAAEAEVVAGEVRRAPPGSLRSAEAGVRGWLRPAPAEPGTRAVALWGREGPGRTAPGSTEGRRGLHVSGRAGAGPAGGERLGSRGAGASAAGGRPSPTPYARPPAPLGAPRSRWKPPLAPRAPAAEDPGHFHRAGGIWGSDPSPLSWGACRLPCLARPPSPSRTPPRALAGSLPGGGSLPLPSEGLAGNPWVSPHPTAPHPMVSLSRGAGISLFLLGRPRGLTPGSGGPRPL